MKLRKLFPVFSCFFLLFLLSGMSGCTGDDETITIELEQCSDGSTANVTEGEECPPPTPLTPLTPPTPPEPGAGSGECNLNATGKAPFNGSSGDDVICGDDDNNTIDARGGDDVVRAKGGNDIVDGGSGNDEIYGEAGDDRLTGGEDEDILDGGAGDDTLIGNEGRDEFKGGAGSDDTVEYPGVGEDGTGANLDINLADGYSYDEYGDQDEYDGIENIKIVGVSNTTYTITGDGKANRLTGGAGNDTINGGGGNDIIDAGGGTNTVDGGEGTDTLVVGEATVLGTDTPGFENLQARAGDGDLNLTGDNQNNVLTGNEGVNVLDGMGGNDMLVGGAGNDTLKGGLGKNTLTGGAGGDCFEIQIETPVVVDTVRDFGEGDGLRTTGDLPTGAVARVLSGRLVSFTAAVLDDAGNPATPAKTTTLATVPGLRLESGVTHVDLAGSNYVCSN